MKTLHSIFHHKLFRTYFIILFSSIFAFFLSVYIAKKKSKSEFMLLIDSLAFIYMFIAPLTLAFVFNNQFPRNIKYLINQHFNRLELIKFFFLSQTLKIILSLSIYFVLLIIANLKFGALLNTWIHLPKFSNLFSNYFTLYIAIISFGYFLYIFPLFGANIQDLQAMRSATPRKSLVRNQRIYYYSAPIAFFMFFSVPGVLKGYLWWLFIAFASLMVLNRTFKIVEKVKFYKLGAGLSLGLSIPLVLIILGVKYEAGNKDLSYRDRISSVLLLDWMNSDYSRQDVLNFLKTGDKDSYHDLLVLFQGKIDFQDSLQLVDSKYKGKVFIDTYTKKLEENKVKLVIDHMADLMKNKSLDFNFAANSDGFFRKQIVSKDYIKELVGSPDSYKQLAAIYFAKNKMEKEEYFAFYRKNLAHLDKNVVNTEFVKRSIATISLKFDKH